MKHIEINILQFLSLLIFIYVFTYFWLPKVNIYGTQEYKKLVNKYMILLEEKNNLEYAYSQIIFPNNIHPNNIHPNEYDKTYYSESIGTKNSAHSSAIMPRNIKTNDNNIVNQFLY
jgi:hypothetical protein